jgi:hypothetical protein
MKTRSSSGVGQKVDLEFNLDTLRITDLGEDEYEGNIAQSKNAESSGIYQGLKRTSAVSENNSEPDPTKGIAVKKSVAKPTGSQVRNMLASIANLNPEKD